MFVLLIAALGGAHAASAQIVELSQFNPSGAAGLCGTGFDQTNDGVWVYDCSAADVQRYATDGTFLSSVSRPGEAANDVDVEFSKARFVLDATLLEAGTLLFVNGETGVAEVYALDKSTGAVLETLVTGFGASHVVGGGYHPDRASLFLLQDRVSGSLPNQIGEVDPVTGTVLNMFSTLPDFDVNFGDLDVCRSSGNLLVVSSIETSIGEFAPSGTFIQHHALPAGVSLLSGIAIDDSTGEAWVSGTGGVVWQLGGLPCSATPVPALTGWALGMLALLVLVLTILSLRCFAERKGLAPLS
ncbi:MAG: hypothetical protein JRH16_11755 [Deltaproteobacteria bacterium]|nr:hypothetical protein [Deltaproteobacteria bacterium]MBW2362245.1 hypothetical protein [Deltaproteobacteria bacterium]